jgi:hypothetical protein
MTRLLRILVLVAATTLAGGVRADVEAMDKLQLQFALKASPPCCVIDGRRPESRNRHPLADALPYVEGIKINPTASVVVIGDGDRQAKGIAAALAKAYPGKRIIAVKGGVGVWEAAVASLAKAAAGGATSYQFVIPKNTCESGTPLQQLRSGPAH